MTMEEFTELLGWVSIINIAVLLLSTVILVAMRGGYRKNSLPIF